MWCGSWQNSRYKVPSPPGACFMQIPASELLLFLFSLAEDANSGWIWRRGQTRMLVTEWAWLVGVALPFLASLVKQPCCIVLE